MEDSGEVDKKSQIITTKAQPSADLVKTISSDDDDAHTPAAKANVDHLSEPILLSTGKPLKGILKHRRHSDTKAHVTSKQALGVLEGGAESSLSNKVESPENTTNIDNVVNTSMESVTSSYSGKCFIHTYILCINICVLCMCVCTYVCNYMYVSGYKLQ